MASPSAGLHECTRPSAYAGLHYLHECDVLWGVYDLHPLLVLSGLWDYPRMPGLGHAVCHCRGLLFH
eukprot:1433224-Pyramimonas_sp.AAC.1